LQLICLACLPAAPSETTGGFGLPGMMTDRQTVAPSEAGERHTRAELIAGVQAVEPGVPFQLGVRFRMDPHWISTGATAATWACRPAPVALPAGFTAAS
jgi:hypothetical protein